MIPAVGACVVADVFNLVQGRFLDFIILTTVGLGFLIIPFLRSARLRAVLVNVAIAMAILGQALVMHAAREEVHLGVIWALFLPVLAMLMATSYWSLLWVVPAAISIVVAVAFAPEGHPLWEHPLTPMNLTLYLAFIAVMFFWVIRARRENTRELSELAVSAAELVDAATASEEAACLAETRKARFLAAMSHELRSPMMAMTAASRQLRDREEDPDNIRLVEAISRSSSLLTSLLNDAIEMARSESGTIELNSVRFNPLDVCEDVALLMGSQAANFDVTLVVDADPNMAGEWFGDDTKVRQILVNLISNAVRHSSHQAVLIKALADVDGRFCLTVKDSGTGIPQSAIDSIFDPFFQVEHSEAVDREAGLHSGLGLSIVRDLTTAMNGSVRAESTAGTGTTIEVVLDLEPVSAVPLGDRHRINGAEVSTRRLVGGSPWQRERAIRWMSFWNVDIVDDPNALAVSLDQSETLWHCSITRLKDLLQRSDQPSAPAQEQAVVSTRASTGGGRRDVTIGIAEDDPDIRFLLARLIESLGYRVVEFSDGNSVVDRVHEGMLNALLLDLYMPGLNGLEVLDQLRKGGVSVPVCVLSGNSEVGAGAIAAGAQRFLQKPARAESVASAVAELLDVSPTSG